MTQREFETNMNRMREEWKNVYGTERCKLIWKEVKDFDGMWWERTVDQLIGDFLKPPMLPEIREKASIERERVYRTNKERQRREAEGFYNSVATEPSEDFRKLMRNLTAKIKEMAK
jgi:hypothetical protein